MQFRYQVVSKDDISKRNFDKLGLDPEDVQTYGRTSPDEVEYAMLLSSKKAEEVKALPYIKSIALPPTDHQAEASYFSFI